MREEPERRVASLGWRFAVEIVGCVRREVRHGRVPAGDALARQRRPITEKFIAQRHAFDLEFDARRQDGARALLPSVHVPHDGGDGFVEKAGLHQFADDDIHGLGRAPIRPIREDGDDVSR